MVSANGIEIDEQKVESIKSWLNPTKETEVKSFHGSLSFYHQFMKSFSSIASPLTEIIHVVPFVWGDEQGKFFQVLKSMLSSSPLVQLLNFDKS